MLVLVLVCVCECVFLLLSLKWNGFHHFTKHLKISLFGFKNERIWLYNRDSIFICVANSVYPNQMLRWSLGAQFSLGTRSCNRKEVEVGLGREKATTATQARQTEPQPPLWQNLGQGLTVRVSHSHPSSRSVANTGCPKKAVTSSRWLSETRRLPEGQTAGPPPEHTACC